MVPQPFYLTITLCTYFKKKFQNHKKHFFLSSKICLSLSFTIKLSLRSTKISQSEKNKYYMISLILESNEQTELTSKIETDIDREQADSSGRGGGQGWRD